MTASQGIRQHRDLTINDLTRNEHTSLMQYIERNYAGARAVRVWISWTVGNSSFGGGDIKTLRAKLRNEGGCTRNVFYDYLMDRWRVS